MEKDWSMVVMDENRKMYFQELSAKIDSYLVCFTVELHLSRSADMLPEEL